MVKVMNRVKTMKKKVENNQTLNFLQMEKNQPSQHVFQMSSENSSQNSTAMNSPVLQNSVQNSPVPLPRNPNRSPSFNNSNLSNQISASSRQQSASSIQGSNE